MNNVRNNFYKTLVNLDIFFSERWPNMADRRSVYTGSGYTGSSSRRYSYTRDTYKVTSSYSYQSLPRSGSSQYSPFGSSSLRSSASITPRISTSSHNDKTDAVISGLAKKVSVIKLRRLHSHCDRRFRYSRHTKHIYTWYQDLL